MSSDEDYDFSGEDYDEQYYFDDDENLNEELQCVYETVECPFEVVDEDQLKSELNKIIEKIRSVTQLPLELCQILLYRYRWNMEKLLENYGNNKDSQDFLRTNRLEFSFDFASFESLQSVEEEICNICYDKMKLVGLSCDHYYCKSCWNSYLSSRLHTTPDLYVLCPETECKQIVSYECTMSLLENNKDKKFFQRKLINSFVKENKSLKWCPAPDCGRVIKLHNSAFRTVTCKCGHSFCFNCFDEWHELITCYHLKKWRRKCQEDKKTMEWIVTNTKDCPNCYLTIEKFEGCNEIACISCGVEFCWNCLKPVDHHKDCNNFEKTNDEENEPQTEVRVALDRYFYYYNHFINNENNPRFESSLMDEIKRKADEMGKKSFSWIETQFLNYAIQILNNCRRTLMYSYAFAFYLKPNNFSAIFNIHQKDLETNTAELNQMLRNIMDPAFDDLSLFKQKVENKSDYIEHRRKILLDLCDKRFEDGEWEFQD